jgi:hypothetical protein
LAKEGLIRLFLLCGVPAGAAAMHRQSIARVAAAMAAHERLEEIDAD